MSIHSYRAIDTLQAYLIGELEEEESLNCKCEAAVLCVANVYDPNHQAVPRCIRDTHSQVKEETPAEISTVPRQQHASEGLTSDPSVLQNKSTIMSFKK